MINENYVEILELKSDGTFSWDPTPLWARPEGRWGITGDTEIKQLRLWFEQRKGEMFRGHWLVLTTFRCVFH